MPEQILPLPIDIPWRRRCVTEDMLDNGGCAGAGPPRWLPSIAILEYEPEPSDQPLDGWTVSYLKLITTITGHSLGENDALYYTAPYFYDEDVNLFLVSGLKEHLPCHGALLHVSVFPPEEGPTSGFPYIADVEPKKRELYERVTQTGSTLSRNLAASSVSKGGLGLSGTEVVSGGTSIDWSSLGKLGGAAAGGAVGGVPGAAVGGAVGGPVGEAVGNQIESLFGDKPTNKAQVSAVEVADRSLEKREEFSYTTQLAQLHSLLTSYHTGTNRVLFFLQPPPHLVQTDATLINGPRALEGIQEFILVVVRPKALASYCVKAVLESAYVSTGAGVTTKKKLWTFKEKENWPKVTVPYNAFFASAQYAMMVGKHVIAGPFPEEPGVGWEFDTSIKDASTYTSTDDKVKVTISIDEVKQQATITLNVPPVGAHLSGNQWILEYPDLTVNVLFHLRKKTLDESSAQVKPRRIAIYRRQVCCCPPGRTYRPESGGVVFTAVLAHEPPQAATGTAALVDANQRADVIGRVLLDSVGSPDRYPRALDYVDTDAVAFQVAAMIGFDGHPDDTPAAGIGGIDPSVVVLIRERAPDLRRSDLLRMTLQELQQRFDLDFDAALGVRRAALRRREEPPPRAGGSAARPREHTLPRLVGTHALDAKQQLRNLRLEARVTEVDSPHPAGRVIAQNPAPGRRVLEGSPVELSVATGLSVEIPEIVGIELSRALCALREAGLRREPALTLRGSSDGVFTVRSVEPAAGELVTPDASVRITAEAHQAGRRESSGPHQTK